MRQKSIRVSKLRPPRAAPREPRPANRFLRRFALSVMVTTAFSAAMIAPGALADTPPTATINPVSEVGYTTAEASGSINPEGGPSEAVYRFEVSTEPSNPGSWEFAGGQGTITGAAASGTSPIPVEGELEDLRPGTEYFVRLVGFNQEFANRVETTAPYPSFVTRQVATPAVTVNDATDVAFTSAAVEGTVEVAMDDRAFEAYCSFEYVTEAQYQENVANGLGGFENADSASCEPEEVRGSEVQPVTVNGQLAGLHPNATYHLRLMATNAGGSGLAVAAHTFTTEPVTSPAASLESVTNFTSRTAHFVGHINPNAPEAAPASNAVEAGFAVHWHFQCSPECPGLEGTVPAGDTSDEISDEATNLTPGTEYQVSLIAENAGGEETRAIAPQTFTTPGAPPIIDAAEANTSGAEATLSAQINPGGALTEYHFEYLTDAQYQREGGYSGPAVISTTKTVIGADNEFHEAKAQIGDLLPGVTYHFRLVATNVSPGNPTVDSADKSFATFASPSASEETCPNEGLRDGASSNLPECRAYELVSPPSKNGASIGEALFAIGPSLSDDGERLIATTIQCFAKAASCTASRQQEGEPVAFTREADGWTATSWAPSPVPYDGNTEWLTNADGGTALFTIPTSPGGEDDLYARQSDGQFQDIGATSPPQEGALGTQPLYEMEATANLSHVIYTFSNTASQWPFDMTTTGETLYEYVGVGNTSPRLVAVSGPSGSNDLLSRCGTELPSSNPSTALSTDGRIVYFVADACAEGSGANAGNELSVNTIYARIDGEQPDAHTVAISEPSPSACGQDGPAADLCMEHTTNTGYFQTPKFWAASTDGSKVLFSSEQQLTDGATQNSNNLYLYDLGEPFGHGLTDVSASDADEAAPEVQGVMAMSPDGSHVYFVAGGVLATNVNDNGETALAGADNLYVFERDAAYPGGRLLFIATLASSDDEEGEWNHASVANVSPDGSFLVFSSRGDITSTSPAPGGPAQVYRYDARSENLTRVSVGQDGFNHNGNEGTGDATFVQSQELRRNDPTMSDNGQHIFFMSPIALTPLALDDVQSSGGPQLAQNVYEWREDGVSACRQTDGCVDLISDGRDTSGATRLIGSDVSGANVFFSSADGLVGADSDTQRDYYDARVDGGFAEAASSSSCEAEECREPVAESPAAQLPATANFFGPRPHLKHRRGHHHRRSRHLKRKRRRRARRDERHRNVEREHEIALDPRGR